VTDRPSPGLEKLTLDVYADNSGVLTWAGDVRQWRRCHAQMVFQAIQAVLFVACLDKASQRYIAELAGLNQSSTVRVPESYIEALNALERVRGEY
jgi:hypothetical protein